MFGIASDQQLKTHQIKLKYSPIWSRSRWLIRYGSSIFWFKKRMLQREEITITVTNHRISKNSVFVLCRLLALRVYGEHRRMEMSFWYKNCTRITVHFLHASKSSHKFTFSLILRSPFQGGIMFGRCSRLVQLIERCLCSLNCHCTDDNIWTDRSNLMFCPQNVKNVIIWIISMEMRTLQNFVISINHLEPTFSCSLYQSDYILFFQTLVIIMVVVIFSV